MLREFQKAPKTVCRAAAKRTTQPAPSLPAEQAACSWGLSPARTEALSCSAPEPDYNAARLSLHSIFRFYRNLKKTDVFLPLSSQQCPALPARRLTVLCTLATAAYPSPSAALKQASGVKQWIPGRHHFLTQRCPLTLTSGGARGWQTGPAATAELLQFSF